MKEQLEARYISNTEALVMLEKRWKELGPDASKMEYTAITNSVRHLRLVIKCTLDKVRELDEFLKEMGLEEEARVAIENECPTEVDFLKVVLGVVPDLELSEEEMEQIVEKVRELLSS
ncbi:hypothetical protein [Ignicoccus hospitalis]|uniref:Uncharacterized protein n=1 Tax=Ignicoccus hospitalis (strain KIN4/I / DSM 18386 / JCM 14125) TaxID=453591 RepID=A8AB65_IGNH4|nr:hypothetical protein [Ignicoccus hospitalis]ABU82167.1 hypothetical protein Igni_0988 [Ignicoccus hospitalis KIN4/I]HIH91124.1 hypothetical protein [Desulfurococcaceae archaeon]